MPDAIAAPFAACMQQANDAVFSALADAVATIASVEMPAIFDAAYSRLDVGAIGMSSQQPAVAVPMPGLRAALAVLGGWQGARLQLRRGDGFDDFIGDYEIAEEPHDDGAGTALVLLQRVEP